MKKDNVNIRIGTFGIVCKEPVNVTVVEYYVSERDGVERPRALSHHHNVTDAALWLFEHHMLNRSQVETINELLEAVKDGKQAIIKAIQEA